MLAGAAGIAEVRAFWGLDGSGHWIRGLLLPETEVSQVPTIVSAGCIRTAKKMLTNGGKHVEV
jgi:hypothetical protein